MNKFWKIDKVYISFKRADQFGLHQHKEKKLNILPTFKMVDTCAAEFEAITTYFYSTYDAENEAIPLNGEKALVLG